MLAAHNSRKLLTTKHVIDEIPDPVVKPQQVLIEVHASSVNPLDWKLYKGVRYVPFKKIVLGHDVAGVVTQVGDKVTTFKPGDEVYCCLPGLLGGAYAEQVAVAARNVSLKPENLSMQEAAATPLAALTAWQALKQTQLKANDSILIIGASGGVGTFAVQLAKAMGADVTGVCGTSNIDLVLTLGADDIIDYTQHSIFDNHQQYDVIFDVIGHESLHSCRYILKSNGRYITTNPNPRSIMDIASHGLRANGQRASFISMKANGQDLMHIKTLIEAGKVKPIIDKQYSLDQIDEAYAYSQMGHSRGKIVINLAEPAAV
ncbi:MAG: zinc-binding alcohol dehydrogenase [Pseudomonadales bacterium]|nr:zinc-binding alcohol dehydrogenase [Pseudomonadales bacterium]RLU01407.1 MAG: NAD(P)-dependent alcohol dehydrogenase [Ketobacter sp.]